jgi:acyl carrier protein
MDCPYAAVRTAVCRELGLLEDEVSPECSLVDDYGADRHELVEILRAVERSTGLRISAAVTVGDLVELVTAAAARAVS